MGRLYIDDIQLTQYFVTKDDFRLLLEFLKDRFEDINRRFEDMYRYVDKRFEEADRRISFLTKLVLAFDIPIVLSLFVLIIKLLLVK